MSLLFNGGTDHVLIATNASNQDLSSVTVMMWIKFTSITQDDRLWTKNAYTKFLAVGYNVANQIYWNVGRATTASDAASAQGNLATATWYCIGLTYDEANGCKIYRGSLASAIAEETYDTSFPKVGSGTTDADEGGGNGGISIGDQGDALAFHGNIAVVAYLSKVLTLGEMKAWQYSPKVTAETVAFHHLGYAGTSTQPDWSGHSASGTVTGATVAVHVPLRPPFGGSSGWRGQRLIGLKPRLVSVRQAVQRAANW